MDFGNKAQSEGQINKISNISLFVVFKTRQTKALFCVSKIKLNLKTKTIIFNN